MDLKIGVKQAYIASLALYIACVPLGTLNIGAAGSLLKVIGILPMLFACCNFRVVHFNKTMNGYLGFAVWVLISTFWSINPQSTISRAITIFEFYVLIVSSGLFAINDKDMLTIKRALVWSSRITALLVITTGSLFDETRLTLQGTMNEDPNYLCMYFGCGIVFALSKAMSKGKLFFRLANMLELIGYIYLVLLTGSRGGLLAALACVASYLLFYSENGKRYGILKRSIFLIISVVIIYRLFTLVAPQFGDRYSIENVIDSGGSGRIDIWRNGIEMYKNAGLFRNWVGYGAATVMRAFILNGYVDAAVMHNIFLETLVELGIVGFALYVYMLLTYGVRAFHSKDKFALCVMIGFIVLSFSTSLYAFKPYINILIYLSMAETHRKTVKIGESRYEAAYNNTKYGNRGSADICKQFGL